MPKIKLMIIQDIHTHTHTHTIDVSEDVKVSNSKSNIYFNIIYC